MSRNDSASGRTWKQKSNLRIRRGTSACWMAFGPWIYAKSTHHRLRLPPATASVLVQRVPRDCASPALRCSLLYSGPCGGLALGYRVIPGDVGLRFSMVLTPMIFVGCACYRWSALGQFLILQRVVLVNPSCTVARACVERSYPSSRISPF